MIAPTFLQPIFATFGAIDPFGNVPVFLALTSEKTKAQRREIAFKATTRAAGILTLFTLAGSAILDVFAISLASFRIAGGIILFMLGLQMIFDINYGGKEEIHAEGVDVATVPLATPLLAGPGTISMSIVLVKQYGFMLTLLGIFVNLVITYFAFRSANRLLKLLGQQGAQVFAKIMGLIVTAVGVELIRMGLAV